MSQSLKEKIQIILKKKRKKKKKKVDEEVKLYPNHKYSFPLCGSEKKKVGLDSIFEEYSSGDPLTKPISLSYYHNKGTFST